VGRPINKKFFGNLNNQGYQHVGTDSGIGGEGIASFTNPGQLGSILVNNTNTSVPALQIPGPDVPSGTAATAAVVWEVESVVVTSTGSAYTDTLPAAVTFTGLGNGVIATLTTTVGGSGKGLGVINFSSTTSNRGSFPTIPVAAGTYEACTAGNPTGGGNNGQVNIYYRVKSITPVNTGSGYGVVPTVTWNNAGVTGTPPGNPTAVLRSDNDLRRAIVGQAYLSTGTTALEYDIVKQEASRRYLVKNTEGIGQCQLVTTSTLAAGEMYIVATDYYGSTYFVEKLTAHRAVLVRKTQGSEWEYLNDSAAGWNVTSATTGTVSIAHTL
jgi:hypothetical protein